MWALVRSGWTELTQRPSNQIPALDGLRAAAVLLVIADHFAVTIWQRHYPTGTWLTSLPFVHFGWTGVDLFFVLSGFLIGRQVWQEKKRTGAVNFPRFFVRRAFRIWPLYFATLLLMAAGLGHIQPRWPDWLLVSNYFPTPYARSWSLSTEEMFYIVVPLLVGAIGKIGGKGMFLILVASVVAIDGIRYFSADQLYEAGRTAPQVANTLYAPFHLHNQALLAGLVLSFLAVHRPAAISSRQGRFSRAGLGVLVLCLILGFGLRSVNDTVFSFTALALVYGGLTYFLLRDDSRVGRIFGWNVLYPVSRLSYGMYLNHLVFGFAIAEGLLGWLARAGVPNEAAFVLGLGCTIAVSALAAVVTFLLVEHPFLQLRSRWVRASREAHARQEAQVEPPAA